MILHENSSLATNEEEGHEDDQRAGVPLL